MRMTRPVKQLSRLLALALILTLVLGLPARAGGFWDWLTGGDDDAAEAAVQVTLPPADALQPMDTLPPEEPIVLETPTPAPTATFAPIPDATIEDDGMLRVWLASLNAPQQLHLTLAGVYAVDGDPGFRFDRDARVALSGADGRVYLSVGGLTIDMGASMTLTRHRAADGAENGLYIDESEKDTLYAGDLTVSIDEANGLRAVLKLPVEDYLYGVVAYEMNDSFPPEALKAQAVAARTYALQRKWQSAGRDYDVADTTADQVFKGFSDEYANVIGAVDDTRGVVGLYNGAFAVCYYTASNGGQTALSSQVLGNVDSDAYLQMADDPYDVENPRSLQNELTITATCEGSDALKAMLEAALSEQMAVAGYEDGEWRLERIESVEPVNPRYEGSRMYEGLAFGLRVQVLEPVATPEPTATPEASETPAADGEPAATPDTENETVDALAAALTGEAMATAPDETLPAATEAPMEWVLSDETYTVTLDTYSQIKRELSLGLNGSDCELVSVETEEDDAGAAQRFTIVMRRFGHGVGMSQRGAQWMAAQYGKGWREILAFYYPGLSFERMAWPDDALTDLAALPDSVGAARPKPTPTPTPAPLPALKAGERYAVVTATSLNLRQQPSTASMALAQLAKGRRVIVSGEPDADGWVPVHTAELSGYVKAEYLEME